jgi:hypothetical protein
MENYIITFFLITSGLWAACLMVASVVDLRQSHKDYDELINEDKKC